MQSLEVAEPGRVRTQLCLAHWMVLFSQPWKCWGDFLPRPGGHPHSSSLRESMRGLGMWPCFSTDPWFLPLSPEVAEEVSPPPTPLFGGSAAPTPYFQLPQSRPRPPLQPGGKKSPERSPTTFPLESAASAFDGETIWSVLWAVEKAESRKM